WKDARIERLWAALEKRWPEATLVEDWIPDKGVFDECAILVLNAPVKPAWRVNEYARNLFWEIWGDDPWPASVQGVGPADTAKYYSHRLPKKRVVAKARRPRVAAK